MKIFRWLYSVSLVSVLPTTGRPCWCVRLQKENTQGQACGQRLCVISVGVLTLPLNDQSSSSLLCRYGAYWVCLCFHNPPNSDMDCTCSFCVNTRWDLGLQSHSNDFLRYRVCLVLWRFISYVVYSGAGKGFGSVVTISVVFLLCQCQLAPRLPCWHKGDNRSRRSLKKDRSYLPYIWISVCARALGEKVWGAFHVATNGLPFVGSATDGDIIGSNTDRKLSVFHWYRKGRGARAGQHVTFLECVCLCVCVCVCVCMCVFVPDVDEETVLWCR